MIDPSNEKKENLTSFSLIKKTNFFICEYLGLN